MNKRISGANETIEHYIYMTVDGHKLSQAQINHIKELFPLLCGTGLNWAKELLKL